MAVDGDAFDFLEAAAINDAGELVFSTKVNGDHALYTTVGGSLLTVLKKGDQLFGNTVLEVTSGKASINGMGQLAFRAILDSDGDGNGDFAGIYLAQSSVPEPNAYFLIFVVLTFSLLIRKQPVRV